MENRKRLHPEEKQKINEKDNSDAYRYVNGSVFYLMQTNQSV